MKLYYASKCIVDHPDVSYSRDLLDFGKGFYLTSLEEQARKYALRFLQRGEKAYMNHYVLDEDLCDCRVKIFDSYDEEWLDFVFAFLYNVGCTPAPKNKQTNMIYKI